MGAVVNTGHQKFMLPFLFHHTDVRRLLVKDSRASAEFVVGYKKSR